MLNLLSSRSVNRIVLLVSLSCAMASIFAQYFLGNQPCVLCLVSRYGYLIFALLAIVNSLFGSELLCKIQLSLSIVGLGFAFYHLGVENKWWSAPKFCVSEIVDVPEGTSEPEKMEILTENIFKGGRPACNSVNWEIFGVSSTLLNFLVFSGIAWLVSVSYFLELQKRQTDIMSNIKFH
jgi:disulfide bond formation protein DsbB